MTRAKAGAGPSLARNQARQLEVLHRAVCVGMAKATTQLSQFVGQPLSMEAPRLGLCAIEDLVSSTLGSAFDREDWSIAESVATGIYLGVSGDVPGHFVLLLPPQKARALVSSLVNELTSDPAQRDTLTISALGEVGNITASSLLNALADAAQLRIMASCPLVFTDMAGAILEMPMLDLAQASDQAIFIETRIETQHDAAERQHAEEPIGPGGFATNGSLALIPRMDGLQRLIEGLMHQGAQR